MTNHDFKAALDVLDKAWHGYANAKEVVIAALELAINPPDAWRGIERVARSICLSLKNDPDYKFIHGSPKHPSDVDLMWQVFIPHAKSAISAMIIQSKPVENHPIEYDIEIINVARRNYENDKIWDGPQDDLRPIEWDDLDDGIKEEYYQTAAPKPRQPTQEVSDV